MRPVALRTVCAVLVPLAAAGCSWTSWTGSIFTEEKIQYKAADTSRVPLDVPPDLSQLPREERFAVPERPQAVTASGLAQQGRGPLAGGAPGAAASASAAAVLPGTQIAKVERAGNTRWLAVNLPPEKAWPILVEFWPSVGLTIARQDPNSGTLETNWAENRAKLPQDVIRATLGKVLDSIYSTGEQDMYRARLERGPDGTSEIFVSHRGMIEVYTSADQTQTKWQPRPADPQLEGEMLTRLQARFDEAFKPATARGGAAAAGPTVAAAAAAAAAAAPALSEVVKGNDGRPVAVMVNEPFDRAWRRVGQSLDRGGFTVEDRARDRGIYFVRYLDPDYEAKAKDQQGFLTKFFGKERPVDAPQYQVKVVAEGERTRITVSDKDGNVDTTKAADRILTLLADQLR
jgi:outer membrane protein assembly factor BamC